MYAVPVAEGADDVGEFCEDYLVGERTLSSYVPVSDSWNMNFFD